MASADLAQLQVALLQPEATPEAAIRRVASGVPAAIAEDAGFTVLGWGSTRTAVQTDRGAAKVAHGAMGLIWNLQEMAAWQTFPDRRPHLAACLELTPELVLIQERLPTIGPPASLTRPDADWWDANEADQIRNCRASLGLWTDPNASAKQLRANNYGWKDGRAVLLDYGDQFPPLYSAWKRLLGTEDVERLSWLDLTERAGLTAENTTFCPCTCGGAFGEGDPERLCGQYLTIADHLAELGHDVAAPQSERTAA